MKIIQKVTGTGHLEPVFEPPRNIGPAGRRVGDPSKARRLLGFETRIDLESGFQDLYQWLRSVPRLQK
mgnify:FL=1